MADETFDYPIQNSSTRNITVTAKMYDVTGEEPIDTITEYFVVPPPLRSDGNGDLILPPYTTLLPKMPLPVPIGEFIDLTLIDPFSGPTDASGNPLSFQNTTRMIIDAGFAIGRNSGRVVASGTGEPGALIEYFDNGTGNWELLLKEDGVTEATANSSEVWEGVAFITAVQTDLSAEWYKFKIRYRDKTEMGDESATTFLPGLVTASLSQSEREHTFKMSVTYADGGVANGDQLGEMFTVENNDALQILLIMRDPIDNPPPIQDLSNLLTPINYEGALEGDERVGGYYGLWHRFVNQDARNGDCNATDGMCDPSGDTQDIGITNAVVEMSNLFNRLLPGYPVLLVDMMKSGSSRSTLVADRNPDSTSTGDDNRDWAALQLVVNWCRDRSTEIGIVDEMWYAADMSTKYDWSKRFAPLYFGQYWNGAEADEAICAEKVKKYASDGTTQVGWECVKWEPNAARIAEPDSLKFEKYDCNVSDFRCNAPNRDCDCSCQDLACTDDFCVDYQTSKLCTIDHFFFDMEVLENKVGRGTFRRDLTKFTQCSTNWFNHNVACLHGDVGDEVNTCESASQNLINQEWTAAIDINIPGQNNCPDGEGSAANVMNSRKIREIFGPSTHEFTYPDKYPEDSEFEGKSWVETHILMNNQYPSDTDEYVWQLDKRTQEIFTPLGINPSIVRWGTLYDDVCCDTNCDLRDWWGDQSHPNKQHPDGAVLLMKHMVVNILRAANQLQVNDKPIGMPVFEWDSQEIDPTDSSKITKVVFKLVAESLSGDLPETSEVTTIRKLRVGDMADLPDQGTPDTHYKEVMGFEILRINQCDGGSCGNSDWTPLGFNCYIDPIDPTNTKVVLEFVSGDTDQTFNNPLEVGDQIRFGWGGGNGNIITQEDFSNNCYANLPVMTIPEFVPPLNDGPAPGSPLSYQGAYYGIPVAPYPRTRNHTIAV